MWPLANMGQKTFLIVLAVLGVSSFFYGMWTSVRRPGGYKPKDKN